MDKKPLLSDRSDAGVRAVLHGAMTLVAADGLKGLSLRPLADRLGSTVSALTHRFGLKDELLTSLIEAAAAEDGAFLDAWLERIRALGRRDGPLMAELADAILTDMAGAEALRTRFYCELLQGAVSRPEIARPLVAWSARRREFWRAAAEGVDYAELGDVLHAFSTHEAAHGLAMGDTAAYRWLRRLNLHRLCCGLVPDEGSTDLRQFAVFQAALGDLLDKGASPAAPALTEWQAKAAGHISALIVAEGVDAVTHRAIAARAGMPNSTLAHHFPRREDLLRAGLADIVARIHGLIDPARPSTPTLELTSLEIARATFAISLAATNMPELKGFAADMRRRRGENYVVYLSQHATGAPTLDVLAAQALSLTGQGRLMLDAVLDPAPDAAAFGLIGRLRDADLAGPRR